jgi:outer membrane protein TolC
LPTAAANVKIAGLDLDRKLDTVRAAVVSAHQASRTAAQLIPIARRQVTSAEEALRLTRENLKTGTGLIVDVLLAEASADEAPASATQQLSCATTKHRSISSLRWALLNQPMLLEV